MNAQLYIFVPFHQKDRVKALGARWDAALGKWYVPYGKDVSLFEEWWPSELRKEMAGLKDEKPRKKRKVRRQC